MQALGQAFQASSPVRLPARLEGYLTNVVHTTSSERKLLLDGSPITKFLNVDPSREVSVFGAIWVNASPHRYVEAVKDIENFERGETFMITKRISTPPKVDDFASISQNSGDICGIFLRPRFRIPRISCTGK
jgi:hypothetical protein